MKKYILQFFAAIFILPNLFAQQLTFLAAGNDYRPYFEEAYQLNDNLPPGILEAISYNTTRIHHNTVPENDLSCTGIPKAIGVMGLFIDGKGHFANTVNLVSEASGYTTNQIINSPRYNILATAKYLSELANNAPQQINGDELIKWKPLIRQVAGFPDYTDVDNYLFDMLAWQVFESMKSGVNVNEINYLNTNPTINIEENFESERLNLFRAPNVTLIPDQSTILSFSSTDYGPAIWNPAASCNYSNGRSANITDVVCHIMEGSYAGSISWFQNCAASVSAHYCVRSSDGQITQMVLESNTAWHVGGHNSYLVGIEHEGFASNPAWYTLAQYTASAALTADICASHGLNPQHAYNGTSQAQIYNSSTPYTVLGHTHFPTTKTCPGIYWDYTLYYDLVNGTCQSSMTLSGTTASGTYQANEYINATGTINASSNVIMHAGKAINWNSVMDLKAGAVIDAYVEPCN